MKLITWKDLEPRRLELGLTLPQMARNCQIEEWRFLEMLERGEIETTSSAIMACVAKGYKFERAQCVKMIVHWSPAWPKSRFREQRAAGKSGEDGQNGPPKKSTQGRGRKVQYWPGALSELMERKEIQFEQLAKMVRGKIQYATLREIKAGLRKDITQVQLEALCKALRCKPWEISPEFAPENKKTMTGGVA